MKPRPLRARLLIAAMLLCLLPALLVPVFRFVPPPTTAFMLFAPLRPVHQDWVPASAIAPAAALAVIASEDQKFPEHWGFDLDAIDAAREHNAHSRRVRGASTLSQQTAKNLFLWRGRSYIRKGIEALLTLELELLWPKRRILEVYLNVAQFGPDVYGVEAAAQIYFHRPAAQLSPHQAALLAAVLPNPERLHADRPSAYVLERAGDIEAQMRNLGSEPLRAVRWPLPELRQHAALAVSRTHFN